MKCVEEFTMSLSGRLTGHLRSRFISIVLCQIPLLLLPSIRCSQSLHRFVSPSLLQLTIIMFFTFSYCAFSQTGTVHDAGTKTPLKNATVALKSTGALVLTDEQGRFEFSNTSVIYETLKKVNNNPVFFHNGILNIHNDRKSSVHVDIYKPNGKKITSLTTESFSVNLSPYIISSSMYILRVDIESTTYLLKIISSPSNQLISIASPSPTVSSSPRLNTSNTQSGSLQQANDTLTVSKYLYTPAIHPVTTTNTIYLTKPLTPPPPPGMKAISGGKFMRGSTHTFSDNDEQPVKEITISPFFMDSTEVTQADFKALMNAQPWAEIALLGIGNNYPVWKINWFDAVYYCNARSKRDGLDTVYSYDSVNGEPGNGCTIYNVKTDFDKNGYRLPTEAEWEYAARGGTATEYYWGNYNKNDLLTPKNYAWYDTNAAQPVAMKIPNNFGMYDMAGNVKEYANDYYHGSSYESKDTIDPKGVPSSDYKVLRGGHWNAGIGGVRPAERVGLKPKDAFNQHGFRVAHPYYK